MDRSSIRSPAAWRSFDRTAALIAVGLSLPLALLTVMGHSPFSARSPEARRIQESKVPAPPAAEPVREAAAEVVAGAKTAETAIITAAPTVASRARPGEADGEKPVLPTTAPAAQHVSENSVVQRPEAAPAPAPPVNADAARPESAGRDRAAANPEITAIEPKAELQSVDRPVEAAAAEPEPEEPSAQQLRTSVEPEPAAEPRVAAVTALPNSTEDAKAGDAEERGAKDVAAPPAAPAAAKPSPEVAPQAPAKPARPVAVAPTPAAPAARAEQKSSAPAAVPKVAVPKVAVPVATKVERKPAASAAAPADSKKTAALSRGAGAAAPSSVASAAANLAPPSVAYRMNPESVHVYGRVRDQDDRQAVLKAASDSAGGRKIVDHVVVDDKVGAMKHRGKLGPAAGLVRDIVGTARIQIDGDTVRLSGRVESEGQRQRYLEAAGKVFGPEVKIEDRLKAAVEP